MKTTKQFDIRAVAGVVTGVCLEHRGFGAIQEVMDHLFPGIMTIGCAAMMTTAQDEIRRQCPRLAEFVERYGTPEYATDIWVSLLLVEFPEPIGIEGPLDVPESDIDAAFAALDKGATS